MANGLFGNFPSIAMSQLGLGDQLRDQAATETDEERRRRLKALQDRFGTGSQDRSSLGAGSVFGSIAAGQLFGSYGR